MSFNPIYGIAGMAGVALMVMAVRAPSLPAFKTDAFLARPESERRRSVRWARVGFGLAAFVLLCIPFGLGFLDGYTRSRENHEAARQWLQQVMAQSTAVTETLNRAETELKLDESLAPARLVSREGIDQARRKLEQWSAAITRWETDRDALAQKAEADLKALPMSESSRQANLAGFQRSLAEGREQVKPLIAAKRETIGIARELLDWLQAKLGRFRVVGGEYEFKDNADVARANGLLQRLSEAAQREEQAAKRLQSAAQANEAKAREVIEGKR